MKLGAHQSIAGGLHLAPERARRIDLACFQMFTKAPQSWQEPDLTDAQIQEFRRTCARCGYDRLEMAVHASYLVNPCSANETTREKALQALIADARRCDALDIAYLVFHPGSPGKHEQEEGLKRVAEAIRHTLAASERVCLLIENTAGSGRGIGHSFEQIAEMIDQTGAHRRIGVCFDTAHAFAAGYPLHTVKDAALVFAELDRIIGYERLKWMHLNDSRTGMGSRVDRHARIGEGQIGTALFKWLVNAPFAKGICATLETPLEKNETYEKDVLRLRKLKPAIKRP
ncbi:MAG: deoxyribonuclease IV [Deltaproteobacteria bacterium]|nr:deoxyribonuclease IV [Deltaproteobacteria bacterium]